ncbi:GNAT family N-acetyltransferase [Gracilibacillus alcaliphilus]|uniref:GNAT family N-acetyltransferase n=1 Tax=Gracilibacillus alcaliphilus TaxID=1401441 RepID=UPI00195AB73A|nr:GNAT family protein [Gracilibacillus alcaliphilus]MBM7677892.1 RimJ/RimL family protein N-acetyltransferase [Gracilibacillus alcaliphilus]
MTSKTIEEINLRPIRKSDWEEVHDYASQSVVCQFQPWGPNTIEESQAFVEQILKEAEDQPRTRYAWAVTHHKDPKLIGVGELRIQNQVNKVGEISYIIHPAYWGRGLATKTAKLLLAYGFQQHQLHRIYATCDPKNIGSSKVLQKIGMIKEGQMRENLWIKGRWRDSLLYSILEQEWQKQ